MNIQEYLQLHGYRGLSLLVAKFIERAPAFPGDNELAREIGIVIGHLESALKQLR
jgi:hypothetical protein